MDYILNFAYALAKSKVSRTVKLLLNIHDVMHNAARQSERTALAHLLAALSTATPKQAKEPIFSIFC